MNVLHITTHMGGGVGKAISTLAIQDYMQDSIYKHTILTLQKTEKGQFTDICREVGVQVVVLTSQEELRSYLEQADVVVLSWWQHPQMCKFLMDFPDVPVRMILWSHINGCTYPHLPKSFADLFDYVLFTTPYAYDNPFWNKEEKQSIKKKSEVFYGVGECSVFEEDIKKDYNIGHCLKIGYIGTINYSKIHKDFLKYCLEVWQALPNTRFVMIGESSEAFKEDIKRWGLEEVVILKGYIKDVSKCLKEFDVFGYLLTEEHFGATENALLEAMAVGLPVVVRNQNTERYIVTEGYNGRCVNDEKEYVKVIKELYENPLKRVELGRHARESIQEKYSLENHMEQFHKIILKEAKYQKKHFQAKEVLGNSPIEWFMNFTGVYRPQFEEAIRLLRQDQPKRLKVPEIFKVDSKSSLKHFRSYYPEEQLFQQLNHLI